MLGFVSKRAGGAEFSAGTAGRASSGNYESISWTFVSGASRARTGDPLGAIPEAVVTSLESDAVVVGE